MILRRTSALEFLQLFGGYAHEKSIDVYAKQYGGYDNINYCIVDSFEGIDYIQIRGVLCTSVSHTINEMLEDYNNIDEQSLIEGLSRYYYTHDECFAGLYIKQENMDRFEMIKEWAIEYYTEG